MLRNALPWILITPPEGPDWEIDLLQAALDEGAEWLHIRKPDWSKEKLVSYLENLPLALRQKASLHYHADLAGEWKFGGLHYAAWQRREAGGKPPFPKGLRRSTSFHHPDEIAQWGDSFDYAFCSPVFPSISKKGHTPGIQWDLRNATTARCRRYALGGVRPENVLHCEKRGFDGLALLGAVWRHRRFLDALAVIQSL